MRDHIPCNSDYTRPRPVSTYDRLGTLERESDAHQQYLENLEERIRQLEEKLECLTATKK